MAKTRVHELAKTYGIESKEVLEKLKEMGEFVKSPSSTIELPVEMKFKKQYGEALLASQGAATAAPAPEKAAAPKPAPAKAAAPETAAVVETPAPAGAGRRGAGPDRAQARSQGAGRRARRRGTRGRGRRPRPRRGPRRGTRRDQGPDPGPAPGRQARWHPASRQQPVRARAGHGSPTRARPGWRAHRGWGRQHAASARVA